MLENSPWLVKMPWTAKCTQAQRKGMSKLRGCAALPWGTDRSAPLHAGYSKGLGSEQSCGALACVQPCITSSRYLSSQEVLTTTKHSQPLAPFCTWRYWKDQQISLIDFLPTDVQPCTSQDQTQQLGFLQAGSQPTFGDIKRWRINHCPWEHAPITCGSKPNCLHSNLKLPGSVSQCLACAPLFSARLKRAFH